MSAPTTFDRPDCNVMVSVAGVTSCLQGHVQVRERVAPYKFLVAVQLRNVQLVWRELTGSHLEVRCGGGSAPLACVSLVPDSPPPHGTQPMLSGDPGMTKGVATAKLTPEEYEAEMTMRRWNAHGRYVSPSREAVVLWLLRRCVVAIDDSSEATLLLQVRC